jgi:hypothetical protein
MVPTFQQQVIYEKFLKIVLDNETIYGPVLSLLCPNQLRYRDNGGLDDFCVYLQLVYTEDHVKAYSVFSNLDFLGTVLQVKGE